MSETLLPDFDGPIQPVALAPKRPRRKPTKKKANRAAPAPKPAKRVPKKRKARKTTKQMVHHIGLEPRPLYSGRNFSENTYSAIKLLLAMDQPMRNMVITIVQGLSDK